MHMHSLPLKTTNQRSTYHESLTIQTKMLDLVQQHPFHKDNEINIEEKNLEGIQRDLVAIAHDPP